MIYRFRLLSATKQTTEKFSAAHTLRNYLRQLEFKKFVKVTSVRERYRQVEKIRQNKRLGRT